MKEVWKEVDTIARQFVAHEVTVGMTLGLLRDGSAGFLSYGRVNLDTDCVPDEHTIFEIGSVSKTFTGMLLAQASLKGLLRLDDTVADYLSRRAVRLGNSTSRITLCQLATHTSGLPNHAHNMRYADPQRKPYTITDLYAGLSDCALAFEPGTKHSYSNLGMILLGHLLELAAAQTYEQLLREWICLPLDMGSTFVTPASSQQIARLSPGHTDGFDPIACVAEPFTPGAGEIRSSASDMVKYLLAYRRPENSPLGLAAAETAKNHCTLSGMGLGWFREGDGVHVWHTGQTLGFRCCCDLDIRSGVAAIIMTNTATVLVDHLRSPLLEILRTGKCAEPVAFPIPSVVSVSADALARLAGTYVHEKNSELRLFIRHEGNKLTAQFTLKIEFPRVRLYPYSPTEFFYRPKPRHFQFVLNAQGWGEKLIVTAGTDKNGTYVRRA